MSRDLDVPALVASLRSGNRRALARLLSAVEDQHPGSPEIAQALAPLTGHASIIGLTGPPGVGKSTMTNALIAVCRERGLSVAVLAVDPSSPFSGGALLGDRIRMVRHSSDAEVYVRSMATRGHLGGLAAASPAALRVLDAAGFDLILIETVGVGQSEVHIAGLADSVVVLVAPGMGDSIQAAKAGVLEIADIFVVNKADQDGATATARDLRHMISLGMTGEPHQWRPPVLTTVAEQRKGIDDVLDTIVLHRQWAQESGALRNRRLKRARDEVESIVMEMLRVRIETGERGSALEELSDDVMAGTLDPYSAARDVVRAISS